MSNEIRSLEPKALWNNFANLNEIPRPSKKEERVRQFMVDFGENLGLKTIVDPVGNVIIKKPASKGMENRKTIVMQSHLDMVCQKNSDTDFDLDYINDFCLILRAIESSTAVFIFNPYEVSTI